MFSLCIFYTEGIEARSRNKKKSDQEAQFAADNALSVLLEVLEKHPSAARVPISQGIFNISRACFTGKSLFIKAETCVQSLAMTKQL